MGGGRGIGVGEFDLPCSATPPQARSGWSLYILLGRTILVNTRKLDVFVF